MVQYFMRFVIEDGEINDNEIARRQTTAEKLVDDCDPHYNEYDHRILFELAKRRVNEYDYFDDTSFESDDERRENNRLGILDDIVTVAKAQVSAYGDIDGDPILQSDIERDTHIGMSIPGRPTQLLNDQDDYDDSSEFDNETPGGAAGPIN